jgi:hypothetical protein
MNFADSSFSGSSSLEKLGDLLREAYRMRDSVGTIKGVEVRVKARAEAIQLVNPPRPDIVLKLLDAENGKIVDVPRARTYFGRVDAIHGGLEATPVAESCSVLWRRG